MSVSALGVGVGVGVGVTMLEVRGSGEVRCEVGLPKAKSNSFCKTAQPFLSSG